MAKPTCPECGTSFPAAGGGHCRGGAHGGCCQTFTSDTSFDAHRAGPWTARTCLPVTELDGWRSTSSGWTNREAFDAGAVFRP